MASLVRSVLRDMVRPRFGGGPPPVAVTFTGTLPDAIIGQPYNASLTVSPPGSAITLDPAVEAALTARGIAHDGFGNFTSASVT